MGVSARWPATRGHILTPPALEGGSPFYPRNLRLREGGGPSTVCPAFPLQTQGRGPEVRTPQVQRGAGGPERVAPDPRSPSASASWRRQCPVGLVARLWGVIVLEELCHRSRRGGGGDSDGHAKATHVLRRSVEAGPPFPRPAPHAGPSLPSRPPRGRLPRDSVLQAGLSEPGSASQARGAQQPAERRLPLTHGGGTAWAGARGAGPARGLRRGAGRGAGARGGDPRAGGARPRPALLPPRPRWGRPGGGARFLRARRLWARSREAEPGRRARAPSEPRVGPAAGPRRRRAAAPRAAPREQRRPPPPPP